MLPLAPNTPLPSLSFCTGAMFLTVRGTILGSGQAGRGWQDVAHQGSDWLQKIQMICFPFTALSQKPKASPWRKCPRSVGPFPQRKKGLKISNGCLHTGCGCSISYELGTLHGMCYLCGIGGEPMASEAALLSSIPGLAACQLCALGSSFNLLGPQFPFL